MYRTVHQTRTNTVPLVLVFVPEILVILCNLLSLDGAFALVVLEKLIVEDLVR